MASVAKGLHPLMLSSNFCLYNFIRTVLYFFIFLFLTQITCSFVIYAGYFENYTESNETADGCVRCFDTDASFFHALFKAL